MDLQKRVFNDNLWKIISVTGFLFITIFFVLPYLIQVSTYFHEKGHIKRLNEFGVENSYQINLLATIPNFWNPNVKKLGVTKFSLGEYKQLGNQQKKQINIAGIVSDLRFLFLIGVFLSLVNVYIYYKIKVKKESNLGYILSVNWILFMWLLALIQITLANIVYAGGDIDSLVRFLVYLNI